MAQCRTLVEPESKKSLKYGTLGIRIWVIKYFHKYFQALKRFKNYAYFKYT